MKKRNLYKPFILSIVLLAAHAEAKGVSCSCAWLSSSPVLDGKIVDDPVWQSVVPISHFVKLKQDIPANRQTHFRAGYTIDGLYLAVVCDEPHPEQLLTNMKDMEYVWKDDSIQIVIAPNPNEKGTYYHFVANSIGMRYNLAYKYMERENPAQTKIWDWQIATSKGKNYWSVEIFIPFSLFRTYPHDYEGRWLFNIARDSPSGEAEISSWSPIIYRFHEPMSFGNLVFENSFADSKQQRNIREDIKQRRLQGYIDTVRQSWRLNLTRWKNNKDPFYLSFFLVQKQAIDQTEILIESMTSQHPKSISKAENMSSNLLNILSIHDNKLGEKLRHTIMTKEY